MTQSHPQPQRRSEAKKSRRGPANKGGPSDPNHGIKINGAAGQSKAAAAAGGPKSAKQPMVPPTNAVPPKPSRAAIPSNSGAEPVSPIPTMGRLGDLTANKEVPAVTFQFGSISPAAFMNSSRIQLPARTSSAPPNLDEQKLDQARFEHAGISNVPTLPSGPGKQQAQEVKQPTESKATSITPQFPPTVSPQVQYPHQGRQHSVANLHMTPHLIQPQPSQGLLQHVPSTQGGYHHHQAILPATHHITAMAGQLSQMGAPALGNQHSAGSQYGLTSPTQYNFQPRVNKAIKIVNPETHEEVVFDAKARKGDQFTSVPTTGTSNAALPGRVNCSSSTMQQVGSPVNYSGGGIHQTSINYYPVTQTGNYARSGQLFYSKPSSSSSVLLTTPTSTARGPPSSSTLSSSSAIQELSTLAETHSGADPSLKAAPKTESHKLPISSSMENARRSSKKEHIHHRMQHQSGSPLPESAENVPTKSNVATTKEAVPSNVEKVHMGSNNASILATDDANASGSSQKIPSVKIESSKVQEAFSKSVLKKQSSNVSLENDSKILSENGPMFHCAGASNGVEEDLPIPTNSRKPNLQDNSKMEEQRRKISSMPSFHSDTGLGTPSENLAVDERIGQEQKVQNSGSCQDESSDNAAIELKPDSNDRQLISEGENDLTVKDVSVDDKEVELLSVDSEAASEHINKSCTDVERDTLANIMESTSISGSGKSPEIKVSGEETVKVLSPTANAVSPIQVEAGAIKTLQDSVAELIISTDSQSERKVTDLDGSKDLVNQVEVHVHGQPEGSIKTVSNVNLGSSQIKGRDVEVSGKIDAATCLSSQLMETVGTDNMVNSMPDSGVTTVKGSVESGSNLLSDVKDPVSLDNPGAKRYTFNPGNHNVSVPVSVSVPVAKIGSKKKKKKELLAKADAAGSIADLYNAYKAPEENKPKEVGVCEASRSTTSDLCENNVFIPPVEEKSMEKELDDWEDATEIASPVVPVSAKVDTAVMSDSTLKGNAEDHKYTRDFMLTFRDQCRDFPSDFDALPQFFDILVNPQAKREASANMGRQLDRQYSSGSLMPDHRGGSVIEEERWGKQIGQGRGDVRMDMPFLGLPGYRPSMEGVIARIPPSPRSGMPFGLGLISSAPTLTPVMGGLTRSSSDVDRWQRAPSAQKGLMPSPYASLPPLHKTENRYEIGKVTDEEVSKQRQVKGILNKLTLENFEKLFDQVKEVKIGSAHTLKGVISQIFDKALMEPTFCEMYAKFCVRLAVELPEFNEEGLKVTFKRVLLNKCQEEFERGQREQEEADKVEEDGEIQLTKEEREEKRVKARRKVLGNIRFIGELYKKNMLTERIMHECIQTLLGEYENPDEESVESLCKLMATIGRSIDHAKAKDHMDAYFNILLTMSNNQKLSSRIRFMLQDVLDLRNSGWQERRKTEGPKKIVEVHRDAVQERQAGARMPRGSNSGSAFARRVQPDLGMRGSNSQMLSPSLTGKFPPSGALRGFQAPQVAVRASYSQDFRSEPNQILDNNRSRAMPLLQRPVDDGPIMLGPQGDLGRGGMKMRSQSFAPGRSVLTDTSSHGDFRHHGSVSSYSASMDREEIQHRLSEHLSISDKPLIDRANTHGIGSTGLGRHLNRAYSDKSIRTDLSSDARHPQSMPSTPLPSATTSAQLNEDLLKNKSEMALREYFSARDLKEAARCVMDLECPEFHPAMVSQWISQSMEAKTVKRDLDLLADLITYLSKNQPFLRQEHVLKGFKFVLSLLEDTVVDVPRSPDYLASLLGRLVVEHILSLGQVGQIVKNSGIEFENLMKDGICLRIFACTLDAIQNVSTAGVLREMYRTSNLRFEDFVLPKDRNKGALEAVLKDANLLRILQTLEN